MYNRTQFYPMQSLGCSVFYFNLIRQLLMKWEQFWWNESSFQTFWSSFNRFNPFLQIFVFIHFHPYSFSLIFGMYCILFHSDLTTILVKWQHFGWNDVRFQPFSSFFNRFNYFQPVFFPAIFYPALFRTIFGMFCFLFHPDPTIFGEMRAI